MNKIIYWQTTSKKTLYSYKVRVKIRLLLIAYGRNFLHNLIILLLLSTTLWTTSTHAAVDLESLNVFLKNEEANYTDIVDGAERQIRWFNGVEKTALSIIYLHGFSASRQELSPVTETLAQNLGANIYYARLSGHGRSDDAMAEATVEKWLQQTTEAYEIGRTIGDKVIIVSTSTGSTLATWLLSQSTPDMLANIMVSPNFGAHSKMTGILHWHWGIRVAKWLNGDYRSFEPISEKHAKYWTERYPTEALLPVFKLVKLVNSIEKSSTIPQLVIYSPEDKVIAPEKVIATMAEYPKSSVTLNPFNNSTDPYNHVLAGDACSPESNEEMVTLMQQYIESL